VTLSEVLTHVEPSELVALTQDLVRIPSVVESDDPHHDRSGGGRLRPRLVLERGLLATDATMIYIASALYFLEVV
jgi:hypothetical protein